MSVGNQSNRIDEILRALATRFQKPLQNQQQNTSLSPARKKLLELYSKTEEFSKKYVKDSWLKKIVMTVAHPHIKNTIEREMTEKEIKDFLKWVFDLIKDDYEHISMARELKNDNLNKELNEKIRTQFPKLREISELL